MPSPFKGYHGVTQLDTLSSTIFSVVVDVVVRHWVTVVAAAEIGSEGLRALVKDIAAYFYADNILITSTQPKRFQREFNVLMELFNRVSLRTYTQKEVRISCQIFHTP